MLTVPMLMGAVSSGCPALLAWQLAGPERTAQLFLDLIHQEFTARLRAEIELRENEPHRWLERADRRGLDRPLTFAQVCEALQRFPGVAEELRTRLVDYLARELLASGLP